MASKSSSRQALRLIIADDHQVVRQGLVALLSRESDIQIVGEAADGEEAVSMVRRENPDVVVMDLSMPKLDGIRATAEIKRTNPGTRVVGLSMFRESALATQMRRSGVDAYLHKGGPVNELLDAIRNVH